MDKKGNFKNNQNDDWDTILDPYKESIHLGEIEGQEAGLKAGFDDGFQLGKSKALEFGIELGYIRSIVNYWIAMYEDISNHEKEDGDDHDSRTRHTSSTHTMQLEFTKSRISRMKTLMRLIDGFPSADFIFSQVATATTTTDDDDDEVYTHHNFNTRAEIHASTSSEDDNIAMYIDRIRAQFKLLTVQMKVPHLLLKNVMDMPGQGLTPTQLSSVSQRTLTTRRDMSKNEEW